MAVTSPRLGLVVTAGNDNVARWYQGGIASAMAACYTHPFEVVKVHLQTAQGRAGNVSVLSTGVNIVRQHGFLALYNGLTAAVTWHLTSITARMGTYELIKQQMGGGGAVNMLPFHQKAAMAAFAGFFGGIVGAPSDKINVRMQNDIKLPLDQRRNYKHPIDGLIKIVKTEGFWSLFQGTSMAAPRGAFMTIGALACYDQIKMVLIYKLPEPISVFGDNIPTHFATSSVCGFIATSLTQPFDVMKTRLMNGAPPGQAPYKGVMECAKRLWSQAGLFGFFKGYMPALYRLMPQIQLTFIFFEQLRLRFGIPKKDLKRKSLLP